MNSCYPLAPRIVLLKREATAVGNIENQGMSREQTAATIDQRGLFSVSLRYTGKKPLPQFAPPAPDESDPRSCSRFRVRHVSPVKRFHFPRAVRNNIKLLVRRAESLCWLSASHKHRHPSDRVVVECSSLYFVQASDRNKVDSAQDIPLTGRNSSCDSDVRFMPPVVEPIELRCLDVQWRGEQVADVPQALFG